MFTVTVAVPNSITWLMDTRNGIPFTFMTSTTNMTYPWHLMICVGTGVIVISFTSTGSGLDLVIFTFRWASLGPHITSEFLIDSSIIRQLMIVWLSIIHTSAFVNNPTVFWNRRDILALLIYLRVNLDKFLLTVLIGDDTSLSFSRTASPCDKQSEKYNPLPPG